MTEKIFPYDFGFKVHTSNCSFSGLDLLTTNIRFEFAWVQQLLPTSVRTIGNTNIATSCKIQSNFYPYLLFLWIQLLR